MNLTDILKGAFEVYRRNPWALFLVAAPAIPLTVAGILVTPDSWVLTVVILPIALMVLYAVPAAALIRAVADALDGTAPDFWKSYAAAFSRLSRIVPAVLRWWITLQVLSIIVIGAPLAFYLLTRWFFFQQAIVLEDARAGASLKRSGDLVAGSWWRVFGITLVIMIISAAPTVFVSFVLFPGPPGGFDGVGVLSPPAGVSIAVTSLIGALMMPFAVSAETILFFDLRGRRAAAAVAPA